MHDPRQQTKTFQRPDQAARIPDPLHRALFRRRTLDEQQRTFQGNSPSPRLIPRRPNG